MVFRERQEKVAFLDAITAVVGSLYNLNTEKVFGPVKNRYAMEVFQELYDSEVLRIKANALRDALSSIHRRKEEQTRFTDRLDKLGNAYEKKDKNDDNKSKK